MCGFAISELAQVANIDIRPLPTALTLLILLLLILLVGNFSGVSALKVLIVKLQHATLPPAHQSPDI